MIINAEGKIKLWQDIEDESNIQWLLYYQLSSRLKKNINDEGGALKYATEFEKLIIKIYD